MNFLIFQMHFLRTAWEIDRDGNPWFAEFQDEGKIGKVDTKTGKVTKWAPPTPHFLAAAHRDRFRWHKIWFAEYKGGQKLRGLTQRPKLLRSFQFAPFKARPHTPSGSITITIFGTPSDEMEFSRWAF